LLSENSGKNHRDLLINQCFQWKSCRKLAWQPDWFVKVTALGAGGVAAVYDRRCKREAALYDLFSCWIMLIGKRMLRAAPRIRRS
jgi:hypothetical protein